MDTDVWYAMCVRQQVIMPGYCVQGTVGHKILNGAKMVEIDRQNIQVKLAVEVSLNTQTATCATGGTFTSHLYKNATDNGTSYPYYSHWVLESYYFIHVLARERPTYLSNKPLNI